MTCSDKRMGRRAFLKGAVGAAAGVALFDIVPASALGKAGRAAPSNRVVLGCIGVGGMGTGNTQSFLGLSDVQLVAVCDVDKTHAANAKKIVDKKYGNSDCAVYGDFREVIARNDIDAIMCATPDHWHALVGIAALTSGKDVYGEKPFAHDVAEGRAMVDACTRNDRIWQTGSWQRSQSNFRYAAELIRNGHLGKVVRVEVGLPGGLQTDAVTFKEPPAELDYEMWLGPSPWAPYTEKRVHYNWRFQLDYGGGKMMDWIGHHADIANWAMGWEYTGPQKVTGKGVYPTSGIWDAPTEYHVVSTYPGGVELHIANMEKSGILSGTRFFNEKGEWLHVDRGLLAASRPALIKEPIGPDEIQFYHSPGHQREFIDSVKTRKPTLTPAEPAHRAASIGHLGNIAMLTGKTIMWDPVNEKITNDPSLNNMLARAMRPPWML